MMSGKRANLTELQRQAEYNRTHRVGVPNEGERVCPRCKGHGQLNKAIPQGHLMSGHYQPCDRCWGTGCVKATSPTIRGIA
jgi:DnaJ-class molecular chaperone